MTARVAPAVFCEQPERRVREAAPYGHPNPRETGGPVCRPYGLNRPLSQPGPFPSSAPVCALGHLSLSPLSLRDISP